MQTTPRVEQPSVTMAGGLPTAAVGQRRPPRSRERQALWAALGFLLPNLIGFLAFTFFPVVFSFGMAFTNWSLKPSIKFQFIGLRNYSDLLGARPLDHGQPALLWAFVLCAVLACGGAVGAMWANMAQWRGTKAGGVLLAVMGLGLIVAAFGNGGQAVGIAGLVMLICGLCVALPEGVWALGRGTVPAALLVVGAIGLFGLQGAMGRTYAPRDPYFWQYLYNTVYLMLGIPLSIGGSLALALLLNEKLPTGPVRLRALGAEICLAAGLVMAAVIWHLGSPNLGLLCGVLWALAALGLAFNVVVFRTLYYLPTFTAGVAMMILWQALYNPKTGPIDLGLAAIFHALGIHATPPEWLGDVNWAKPALIMMGVWTSIGGMNMLLYLAGLSNLPKELLDAAEVDGAGPWHRFRHVVWPQLAPTTFFITIMSIVGGFQGGFEQARVLTNGGPAGSTTTLSYYIYNKAFQDLDMGYAAAISWVLFAIVFVATALNWKFGKGLETD
ncbi:MAG: sugar ABC transporter permease [Armatimonadota bacterium]|nr:sugar ABC transporter permease [Armatimonadota bacterium]